MLSAETGLIGQNESGTDQPLVSFQGLENDVRKHTIRWIEDNGYEISTEHASYIGRELFRAAHDFNFIQD